MLEVISSQNQLTDTNQVSLQACEVTRFMKNFFAAASDENLEEVVTYYSDDMEPLNFPLNVSVSDELILIDGHLATFGATLYTATSAKLQIVCVLDKSEGYWQIIHGEIYNDSLNH